MASRQKQPIRIYADLIKLSLAMASFTESGGNTGHLKKGEQILKRYKSDFEDMINLMILPLLNEGLPGITTAPLLVDITRETKGAVDGPMAVGVAPVLQDLFGWFKNRQQQLKDRYPDQKSKTALIGISNACLEGQIDLNALLQVPRASRSTSISKWVVKACELTGQANEVEIAISDLVEVKLLSEEIKSVDTRVRAGGLTDEEQVNLLQDRETKFDLLLDMTKNTSNRQAALAEASSILNTNTTFQTRTGEKQGLTPEQEEAMMVSGKSIIAAGAGSGKTRVLASKIAYTINELGVNPAQIIATTFSKEAAGELKKRSLKYSNGSAKGKYIGSTTHSISNSICDDAKVFRGKTHIQDKKQEKWIEAAIEQVSLKPTATPPSITETPFIDTSKASIEEQEVAQVEDALTEEERFQQELKEMLVRTTEIIANKGLWAMNEKNWGWGRRDLQSLRGAIISDNGRYVRLKDISDPIWDDPRFRSVVNNLISEGRGKNSLQKADPIPGFTRFASYPSRGHLSQPLNQYFNLGMDKKDLIGEDYSVKDYATFIGKAKAGMKSPTEMWLTSNADKQFLAVYGAYYYMCMEEGLYDYDDMLIEASRVLVEDPKKLRKMNNTYKYIFVDEAQDLNLCQHILFGLIAGHINPETLDPYGDGQMKADTYCFIGDDKQAIYEFRGADPEEFINQSDFEGGEFKTSILRTNFRSGRNIVQAANKLIEHNDKQIPMVCNPNPSKEEGRISYSGYMRKKDMNSPGAVEITQEMKEIIDIEGWDHEGGEQYKFGVGCRTNRELSGYAYELLIAGLPYYSKRDLINSKTMLAPVYLMSVKSSDPKTKGNALFNGHKSLLFYIDKRFNEVVGNLSSRVNQNPLDWFLDGGWRQVYNTPKKIQNAKAYAEALQSIRDFDGSNSDLLDFVTRSVRGVKGQNLLERTRDNLSVEEVKDLERETERGEVSDETVEDYAISGLDVVRRVFSDRSLDEGLDFFTNLKEQSKAMKENSGKKDCVFLGTMHSWKGLECRDMYLPMTRGEFPDNRSEIESERRLAYVALTRGQDRVKVIYGPGKNPKSQHIGGPSQFITEACIMSESSLNLRSASLKGATIEELDFMYAMENFLIGHKGL
jgi:superfamily I DNA/RNA helicase